MNDVTFIIPNRGGKNIDFVIKNFKTTFSSFFDGIYFIIIEQADNLPFKRGQLYNIAVKFCNTEWIGLIDNDIFNIDKFDPIQIYKNFGNKPFIAFNKIAQADLTDKGYSITKTELRAYGFGAFNFMMAEDFKKANGFSNLCIGWGCEDNIFDYKIKFKRYTHTLGHITHPRRNCDTEKLLAFNKEIFSKYKKNQIDSKFDGFNQTTFNLISIENGTEVTKIHVNNIGVSYDYRYKKLFDEIKEVEKGYIPGLNFQDGISICLTAYKSEKYIKDCITSIINQTWFKKHNNWELLIGIDGCKDTLNYLMTFINNYGTKNIRVLFMNKNCGTYITTNTLMSEAKYDKLIRFDSDDVMPKTFIEDTVKKAGNNICYMRYSYKSFGDGVSRNGLAYGCAMIRKDTFIEYGGYQPWRIAADYELCERIKNHVSSANSDIIFFRRLHGEDSLQFSKETGMNSEIRKQYHEYISTETPNNPIITCVTSDFSEYEVNPVSNKNEVEPKNVVIDKKKTTNKKVVQQKINSNKPERPMHRKMRRNSTLLSFIH